MPFNLQMWREDFKSRLRGWKARFNQAGANSIYYFLAATSLLPVVQAAHSGDWASLAALGTALGGAVSTNLLANMVQKFKDKSDAEVARELEQEAQANPAVRSELDALLEALDALRQAEHALTTEDKLWFERTLQEEIKLIGSGAKYEATLIGNGAIAQGLEAVAVGAGGIYTKGDYIAPGGKKVTAPDLQVIEQEKTNRARTTYLEKLRRHCQVLPLAALGGEETAEEDITLDSVYIDLDTTLNVKAEDLEAVRKGKKKGFKDIELAKEQPDISIATRDNENKIVPLPILDAVIATSKVVLLGDPGAGKSTFARKLLGLQAAVQLGHISGVRGIATHLLPILIVLRELVPYLAELQIDELSRERQKETLLQVVLSYLTEELKRDNATDFVPLMQRALESGEVLIVLDGLDEVPHALRMLVRRAVSAMLTEYRLERLVITSRIRSYIGEAVFENIPTFTLREFDRDKIRGFISGWYRVQVEMGRVLEKDRQDRIDDLFTAAISRDLHEISSNPMMLTSMAIIHQKEIGLPRERVRLYKLVVDVLITRWQKYKLGEGKLAPSRALLEFLKDENRLLSALENLAYKAQSAGIENKKTADLSRMDALATLEAREYLGDPGLVSEFLDYVDQRSGLLRGNGGELNKPTSYSFPHRTFQEYLAGCYMVRERNPAREYYQRAAEGDTWALAAQLGAEELYYNRRGSNVMLDLAYQLLPPKKAKRRQDARAVLWSGMVARIAGTAEILADVKSSDGGKRYLSQLKPRLISLLGSPLPAVERAEAGRVLAKLGDPRTEVLDVIAMQFCRVPAGKFIMGERNEQKTVDLPDYWVGKYPVTNAQFNQFVGAGGYQQNGFWKEAIKDGYWENGAFKGRLDDEPRDGPVDFGEPFTLENHPAVGISWYEALAFARWLASFYREHANEMLAKAKSEEHRAVWQGIASGRLHVTLPTEAEWEKAARGTDGREYPWGKDADPNLANCAQTGIGATSAVGCFRGGRSVNGAEEMSGNVWEWTRSLDSQFRLLCGGAFNSESRLVRCAVRLWYYPDLRLSYIGFRVVVSPDASL
jgi:formylglycine-generating enzyme required for sulfatase activity